MGGPKTGGIWTEIKKIRKKLRQHQESVGRGTVQGPNIFSGEGGRLGCLRIKY